MTYTATFTDATDKGAAKTIKVRFNEQPEDREIEALMVRYNASQCSIRPI